jgi:hypothetical protein
MLKLKHAKLRGQKQPRPLAKKKVRLTSTLLRPIGKSILNFRPRGRDNIKIHTVDYVPQSRLIGYRIRSRGGLV